MRINVLGSIEPYASFTRLTCDVVAALVANGHKVALQTFSGKPEDLTLMPEVVRKAYGPELTQANRINVHFISETLLTDVRPDDIVLTAWETTKLPPKYIEALSRAHMVIGISKFVTHTLQQNGLACKTATLPCCVHEDEFYPSYTTFPNGAVFAAAGRAGGCRARKGIDRVITAFMLAFTQDERVVLRVKLTPDSTVVPVQDPRIQIVKTHLSVPDMRRFYQEALCFVSGSAGEGWGWHNHEAMCCAKPLICNGWSGVEDYFKPDVHGWAVHSPQVAVRDYYADRSVGFWHPPAVDALAAAMREVYDNCVDAYMRGWAAQIWATKFNFERYCVNLQTILTHA